MCFDMPELREFIFIITNTNTPTKTGYSHYYASGVYTQFSRLVYLRISLSTLRRQYDVCDPNFAIENILSRLGR